MVALGAVRFGTAGGARLGVAGFDAALSGSVRQVGQGLVGSGWVWSRYVRQVWRG